MERTFALINGTTVVNSVVADESYIDFVKDQYTKIVETTNLEWKPSIGALYVDDVFTYIDTITETEETTE